MTHQLWCDDTFSQRNKATKRAAGIDKNEKGLSNAGDKLEHKLGHKLGRLETLCELWELYMLKKVSLAWRTVKCGKAASLKNFYLVGIIVFCLFVCQNLMVSKVND